MNIQGNFNKWNDALQTNPLKINQDKSHALENPSKITPLKIGFTALANVVSLPAQIAGGIGGIVGGGGAAILALFKGQAAGEAFSKYGTKGASGASLFVSTVAFPLTAISYGLSKAVGGKEGEGTLARANILLNTAIRTATVAKKSNEPARTSSEPSLEDVENKLNSCKDDDLCNAISPIIHQLKKNKDPFEYKLSHDLTTRYNKSIGETKTPNSQRFVEEYIKLRDKYTPPDTPPDQKNVELLKLINTALTPLD